MADAGIKAAIQGSNGPNTDEAVRGFGSGVIATAGKGLFEGTLQAGTSDVSDKLLDLVVFFFQAEDGIRDLTVTGVQTCALPICSGRHAGHGTLHHASQRLYARRKMGEEEVSG